MIPFIRHLPLSIGVLCGFALSAHATQAPQHIDIKKLTTTVEDVVVPLPNEMSVAIRDQILPRDRVSRFYLAR